MDIVIFFNFDGGQIVSQISVRWKSGSVFAEFNLWLIVLMPWLLASLSHQSPRYWRRLYWINGSLSCIGTAFNCLRHFNIAKWLNMQTHFMFSVNTSTHSWLRNCLSDSNRITIRVRGIVTEYWLYVNLEPPELLGINQIYKNIIGDIAAKSLVLTSIAI